MKKSLGKVAAIFPMPVLIVAAYDENDKVEALAAAWATISDMDKVVLFIDDDHKTTQTIRKTKAFTVSIADRAHMAEADFLGTATGNKMADKFERTGFHVTKSENVNAPIIDEFPVTMECELAEIVKTDNMFAVVGKIVNVVANDEVVDENGKVNPAKLNALIFDQFQFGYYASGDKIGQAWHEGKPLMK